MRRMLVRMKIARAQSDTNRERRRRRGGSARRWLLGGILLLVLAGLFNKMWATAGDEWDADATAPSPSTAASVGDSETTKRHEHSPSLVVGMNVQKRTVGDDTLYIFALGVATTNPDGEIVTFPTGQTHDFVVIQDERELWRWSAGQAFHLAFVERTMQYGELTVFVGVWDGRDASGRPVVGDVEVHGVVKTAPSLSARPVVLHLE